MTRTTRLRVGAALSLTGRFARFGQQAAAGLRAWRDLAGADADADADAEVDLTVEDDGSDPTRLRSALADLGRRSDVLLGPYSTQLVRHAARLATDAGWLLWNHGGSGDDVESAAPGHAVSVLTPASRYAAPFVDRLAAEEPGGRLWARHGAGRFGRQAAQGAARLAAARGIEAVVVGPEDDLAPREPWHLFSAGTFEDDVAAVRRATSLPMPPATVGSVAAGVLAFAAALGSDPTGTFGVAQWVPGQHAVPAVGPAEATFVAAYAGATGTVPDYPAVQAVAAASLAIHCVRTAGSTGRDAVWSAAACLDTTTLYGPFAIDPRTGAQEKHETVLVRWSGDDIARQG